MIELETFVEEEAILIGLSLIRVESARLASE